MIEIGEKYIWRPKDHANEVHEALDHPWYGSTVIVIGFDNIGTIVRCRIVPEHIPNTNDPGAFRFLADDYELEKNS